MSFLSKLALFVSSGLICDATQPNPPWWDTDAVKIIDPADDSAQAQQIVDAIFAENGGDGVHGEFSDSRYAIMFKRGQHDVRVKVGFYTQVLGLGDSPSDVTIADIYSPNGSTNYQIGALDNFWRSVEGAQVNGNMVYAVSQAAPLRRMQINGNLDLFKYDKGDAAGYASGGFMADVTVTGWVNSGSQQQWLSRNSDWDEWTGSNWNMVFQGCMRSPGSHCGRDEFSGPYTNVPFTELIAEKPYITESDGKFFLNIPKVEQYKFGTTQDFKAASDIVDFSQVFVANKWTSAAEINRKLDEGLHIVLQPGNYQLTESIKVNKDNAVILGLGLATLITTNGTPCIEVGNVNGVRIAGVLLQAGEVKSDSLLKWGEKGFAGSKENPGVMSDVFARVGGPNDQWAHPAKTDTMVTINSGYVVIDNTWLWRADHDKQGIVTNGNNPVTNGIVINGDNVFAYGLAAEHTLGDMVVWNGNYGNTVFYQSEYPYDVDTDYATNKFASYKVADSVTNHTAFGVGVYSYFRDHDVNMDLGIQAPAKDGVYFKNSLSVFLNGNGAIKHVINDIGDPVNSTNQVSYTCEFGTHHYWAPKTPKPEEISFLQ